MVHIRAYLRARDVVDLFDLGDDLLSSAFPIALSQDIRTYCVHAVQALVRPVEHERLVGAPLEGETVGPARAPI